jgi:hypothetical protein
MTWQPTKLSIEEFEARVRAFPWNGKIIEVHPHHTAGYKSTWRGAASIKMLRDDHVERRGWRDCGQHVTLDPDGNVWLGRDWNWHPASANGFNPDTGMLWNGTDNRDRPFMCEIFGHFEGDHARPPDVLQGQQRESLVRMIAAVQAHFGLPADAIRFHREMQATACPGKISKTELISSVRTYQRDAGASLSPVEPTPDSVPGA